MDSPREQTTFIPGGSKSLDEQGGPREQPGKTLTPAGIGLSDLKEPSSSSVYSTERREGTSLEDILSPKGDDETEGDITGPRLWLIMLGIDLCVLLTAFVSSLSPQFSVRDEEALTPS